MYLLENHVALESTICIPECLHFATHSFAYSECGPFPCHPPQIHAAPRAAHTRSRTVHNYRLRIALYLRPPCLFHFLCDEVGFSASAPLRTCVMVAFLEASYPTCIPVAHLTSKTDPSKSAWGHIHCSPITQVSVAHQQGGQITTSQTNAETTTTQRTLSYPRPQTGWRLLLLSWAPDVAGISPPTPLWIASSGIHGGESADKAPTDVKQAFAGSADGPRGACEMVSMRKRCLLSFIGRSCTLEWGGGSGGDGPLDPGDREAEETTAWQCINSVGSLRVIYDTHLKLHSAPRRTLDERGGRVKN